jgi:hypothetical protein
LARSMSPPPNAGQVLTVLLEARRQSHNLDRDRILRLDNLEEVGKLYKSHIHPQASFAHRQQLTTSTPRHNPIDETLTKPASTTVPRLRRQHYKYHS